jgi:hypothetical protein
VSVVPPVTARATTLSLVAVVGLGTTTAELDVGHV